MKLLVKLLDAAILQRFSGLRVAVVSGMAGACATVPLLLYIVLGPADGNPIGLGLLAVICVPIATLGVLVGLVTFAVQWLSRRS